MLRIFWMMASVVMNLIVAQASSAADANPPTFEDDVAFLEQHTDVIVLGEDPRSRQVAVVPAWQGRVMTSTTGAAPRHGLGWINYALIRSRQWQPHINAYGGEDRFWLGPEGGQFAIFFRQGDPFDLQHWQTPALIDSEPFEMVSHDGRQAVFQRTASLANYSATRFDLRIERTIRLLRASDMRDLLGIGPIEGLEWVAFESDNQITNTGSNPWRKANGLLSLWILGMFKHSAACTVVIPLRNTDGDDPGPVVNDQYFGQVPDDRLSVADGVVYFKADGAHRSKIGIGPSHALPVLGSYDPHRSLLTLVHYDLPRHARDYVNSMWQVQREPFGGDVVNSYNDGPPSPGAKPLGPFYELETSSPAVELQPGGSLRHRHRTFHLQGSPDLLDPIARQTLGVGLHAITSALP